MSTKFDKRQLPDSTVYNDEETTFQAKVLLPIATPTDDKEAITFKFYRDKREEIDTALNAKEPAIASGTISQYWRGDKTWQEFPTIQTIDNIPTDGSNNAVSSNGVFDGLALKANLASPDFTGTPTSPTATAGTNTTQVATTAFVTNGIATADSQNVKLTGNQTISGQKSFSLTGKIDMQTNNAFPAISVTSLGSNGQSAAVFINNSSSPYSTALRLQTSLSGGVGNRTLDVSNISPIGIGIVSSASNGSVSISSESGDGDSYVSNITYGGTGRNYVGRNNGTETYSVDKIGNVIGSSYIKRSAPTTNLLLAGGGDIEQGTFALASSVHNPVTLGTANGLSLSNQQLSLELASSGVTGALSGTDWNTFNGKVGGTGTDNFLTKWSGTNTVNASGAWRETSNRLANAADNGSSEFQVTGQIDLKSKNTQGDGGQLGAELLTTGTGDASWTGTSFATGYTHATGSVTTLTSALAPVINNLYQVAYTVTGRTAGSFTIAFGGATTAGIAYSSAVGHRASTTGTLVITPTSDFNGTIILSIKQITAGTASFVFRDNDGGIRSELRILAGGNTASGVRALQNNTTGTNNTANGSDALSSNTTGSFNTANGVSALQSNTTGGSNTANGVSALQSNTIGTNNTANGVSALQSNTIGTNNTANGSDALSSNTTGSFNTANGVSALQSNTTGGSNTANGVSALQSNTIGTNNTANGLYALQNNTIGTNNTASGVRALQNNTTGTNNTASGVRAGRVISNGATSLTVANNSTFLGANTKALSDNSTNETVVGYNAIGDGNNTVSIGNTSIVSSRLRGRLLQGNVVDNSIDSGQFSGNVLATGFKTASGTASQFLKADGSVDSNTYLTSASLPTVDQTIIDGSTNAVSGNAVFDRLALKSNIDHTHVASQITDLSKASVGLGNVDNTSDLSKPLSTATINALATKAPISSVHNPVTLGTPNGLSLSTQQLSLGLASSSTTGALSGTDWNTFNNKQPAITGLTTNYLPKWNGSGFVDSTTRDLGDGIFELITPKGTSPVHRFTQSAWRTWDIGVKPSPSFPSFYISDASSSTDRFIIADGGRILINKTDDDLTNQLQVAGTISASPATTANQVPTWGQVQAMTSSGSYTVTDISTFKNMFVTYTIVGKILILTITGTCDFPSSGSGTGGFALPAGITVSTTGQAINKIVATSICDLTNNKTSIRINSSPNANSLALSYRGVSAQTAESFAMTCQILIN